MGRKFAVMKDRLSSCTRLGPVSHSPTSIKIAIEAIEIAARDLEPDPVPALEQIASRDQVDRELIRSSRFHQSAATRAGAVTPTNNALAEIGRIAIGGDIDQPGGEIGVGRGARCEENQFDWSGNLDLLLEWRS